MRTARPYLALFALALIAFWPLVLHPTETLYSDTSDLLAEHLPAKLFLVRSLRETGELPLWNPEQYAGSPFVHDIQVGLFYPPHLPLYFISEPAVGPFLSWLVFVHVVLAGWLMYVYARHAGLDRLAAFTAGAGYMLAPRWMMQLFLAGHTVTQGICWIPLVLLCVERAIQRRNWRWAVGGGVAYALLILGTHPQWTFYGSLLIGLWPLRLLVRERASRERQRPGEAASLAADYGEQPLGRAGSVSDRIDSPNAPVADAPSSPGVRTLIRRWLVAEAITVLVGLALSAVQLLPTIEAAGESSRARGMGQSWSLDGAKAALTTLIGPIPHDRAEPIDWETRGGIGFGWAVFAIVGARLGGRRAIVPATIAIGMLVYALGGSYFIDRLPGFDNFRMPTRMLLTLAFPVAFLAGLGVQALSRQWAVNSLRTATALVLLVVAAPGLAPILAGEVPRLSVASPTWRAYWTAVPAAWIALLFVAPRQPAMARAVALVVFLFADLMVFSLCYPATRRTDEIYPRSPLVDAVRDGDVLLGAPMYDPDVDDSGDCFLGAGSPVASTYGVRSVRGYNPLDVARYRQFLAFIADEAEPQRALTGNFTNPVTLAFPVRNRKLFDLLGVAWEVGPVDDPPAGGGWVSVHETTDEYPRAYNFLGRGVRALPPMRLYFNTQSMPRAFVVPRATAEAERAAILNQLKRLDLWRTATLADWDPTADPLPRAATGRRWQQINSAYPNWLVIDLDGQSAGLLVLADPWYPGWRCWVDGRETKIWKADYAFRGVMLPAGSKEVVFKFEPRSYRRGRIISLAALIGVSIFALAVARQLRA